MSQSRGEQIVAQLQGGLRSVGLHLNERRVRTWSGGRIQVAVTAVLVGAGTGILSFAQGTPGFGVFVYSGLVLLALIQPAAIAAQVVYGQLILASLLLGPEARPALSLLPLVIAVIVTAELLAVVARLDTPLSSSVGDALNRVAGSAVIGGAVFAAVALTLGLPGPQGLLAVILGSAACVVLALRLWRAAP